MDNIKDLANKAISQRCKNGETHTMNENSKYLNSARMVKLWKQFRQIYGSRHSASFGENASINGELTDTAKTWSKGLAHVSNEDLARGLRKCLELDKEWPPTLPEFINLCKPKNRINAKAYKPFEKQKALPSPARTETVKREMEKIRGILK